jgi:hypothetical protein
LTEPRKYLKVPIDRITVSLNANNHANFVYNGKVIEDTEIVEVNK